MKLIAGLTCLLATPAVAQFDCVIKDRSCVANCAQTEVRFDIDEAQFADPQDSNDPPRRQVTMVTQNNATFAATAIMMPHGVRGFHEDAGELGSRLMIVQADGAARLTLQPDKVTLVGQCTQQR